MQVPYANTTNFSVSYDTTFTGGSYPNGPALAQGVVDYCDYDFARLSLLFGGDPASIASHPDPACPRSRGAANNGSNTIWRHFDTSADPLGLAALVMPNSGKLHGHAGEGLDSRQ